ALIVALFLLALAWRLFRHGFTSLAALLVAALAVQLALGISNVLLNLPLTVAVAHNGGGAALLLVLVLINFRLRQPAPAVTRTHVETASETLRRDPKGTGGVELPSQRSEQGEAPWPQHSANRAALQAGATIWN